jgi:hypothetical protein
MHRYDVTRLGRFSTPDPVRGEEATEPQGLNRYAYVLNGPVNHRDPQGLDLVYDVAEFDDLGGGGGGDDGGDLDDGGDNSPCVDTSGQERPCTAEDLAPDTVTVNEVVIPASAQQVFGQVANTVGPTANYLLYGGVGIPLVVTGVGEAPAIASGARQAVPIVVQAVKQATTDPSTIQNALDFAATFGPAPARTLGGVVGLVVQVVIKTVPKILDFF